MQEVLEELQQKYIIEVEVVDIAESPEVIEKYHVRTVPMFIMLDGTGSQIATHVGMLTIEEIVKLFESSDIRLLQP